MKPTRQHLLSNPYASRFARTGREYRIGWDATRKRYWVQEYCGAYTLWFRTLALAAKKWQSFGLETYASL